MASAAEQMAANLSWSTFGKAKELRQRILFTLGLLIIYRLGTYLPVPGIDAQAGMRVAAFLREKKMADQENHLAELASLLADESHVAAAKAARRIDNDVLESILEEQRA